MKQTSVKGLQSNPCLAGPIGQASDFQTSNAQFLTQTRGNFTFYWNFSKPLGVNSGFKCKFYRIVKNSIAVKEWHKQSKPEAHYIAYLVMTAQRC